jgi:predicted NACHT family NTPase
MGKVETHLIDANAVWDDLISSEPVLALLEETIPAQPETAQVSSSFTTEQQFSVAAALDAYLQACQAQIAHIDPRGYPRSVNGIVPLMDVYIPLRLRPFVASHNRSGYIRYRTSTYNHTELDIAAENTFQRDGSATPSLSIQEVLNRHQQVIVLGGSGAGKSTLLRSVVAEHIRVLQDQDIAGIEIEARSDSALIRLARRLPVYVDLADFVNDPGDGSLIDFVLRSVTNLAHDSTIASVLDDLIQGGQCIFLLDGFDQTSTDEQRRMLAASVSQAAARWRAAGNIVVVASRYEAYAAARLSGQFQVYAIRPLERGQIGPFLLRWSLTLGRMRRPLVPDEEAIRRAETDTLSLVREIATNQRLYMLASTPLILRMLVGVYRPGMLLVPQRVAIYQLVADALIRDWHLAQSAVDHPAVLEQDVTHLLGELAFWLQVSRPTGLMTEQELRDILCHIWAGMYPETPASQINHAIDNFITQIRSNNGVLAELAPQRYGFIYHGLQEYFAARYMVSSFRLAPARIRTYLHDPRWDEVIGLAVAFMAQRSREDASELMAAAILARGPRAEREQCTPSPFEDLLKRDLFFAARLLGNGIEVGTELTQEVASELMNLWLGGDRDSLGRFSLLFDRATIT